MNTERKSQVSAFLKNIGETPAVNVTGFIRKEIREFKYKAFICEDTPETEKSLFTLGPQVELPYETSFEAQPQTVANLIIKDTGHVAGELALYICGQVRYNDIFSSSHHTNFCASYSPKRQMLLVCPHGNTID